MIDAPVGHQCPRCVEEGSRRSRADELRFGGRKPSTPRSTTSILIGLNLAVWLLLLVTGGGSSPLFHYLALMPRGMCLAGSEGQFYPRVDGEVCAAIGQGAHWVPGVADGAVWQLITSGFAHVELLHILGNLLILWFIGPSLERTLGRSRFLAMYLISPLGGSTAVMWLSDPQSSSLGASGAIFGLLGALLVVSIRTRGDVRGVLIWIGLNLVISFMGMAMISWQAHVGGLIGGLITTAIIVFTPTTRKKRAATQWTLFTFLTVGMFILIGVRCLMLA